MKMVKIAWIRLTMIGVLSLNEHDARRSVAIGVNKMTLWLLLVNMTFGLGYGIITGNPSMLLATIAEIFALAAPLVLNYFGKYDASAILLYTIVSAATCFFCCIVGQLAEPQLTIVYLIGLSMFVFHGKKSRIFCITLAIVNLAIVEANLRLGFVKPLVASDMVKYSIRWSAYGVVISLVIYTFHLYRKSNKALLDKVRSYADQTKLNLQREYLENRRKDRFISNAGHELRATYKSIFSIISIIRKKNSGIKMLDDLQAACKYSESFFNNVLEYERYHLTDEKPKVTYNFVDIHQVLRSIVSIYRYMAEEKMVNIKLSVSDRIPSHIETDDIKIRQIVTNLLHNAVKFTQRETTIILAATIQEENLIFSIKDHGDGIDEEIRQSIFQPFVSKNPDGLGLGLYIVKLMVDALDGNIDVKNNADRGTTFVIKLPIKNTVINDRWQLSLS
jgi:signal transduction histidine kinase